MTPLTQEWVDKAEGDFATAGREMRARQSPNFDAVCFHTQQCAEKYLKAYLQEANVPFSKTHDLEILLQSLETVDSAWAVLQTECTVLSDFAVTFRYPGRTATREQAKEAFRLCGIIRAFARPKLGLA